MNRTIVCFLLFSALDAPAYTALLYNVIPTLVAVIGLAANAAFIFCMRRTGQTSKISNKLVILMTSSDLVLSVFLPIYFSLVATNARSPDYCALKKIVEFTALTACHFSFNVFCCITLDRYLHIKKAMTYDEHMNGFRFKVLVGIAFSVAALTVLTLAIFPSFPVVAGSCLISVICIVMMIIANIAMTRALKSYQFGARTSADPSASARAPSSTANPASNSRDAMLRNSRPVKTLRLLTLVLAVFYVPYDICTIAWTYKAFYSDAGPGMAMGTVLYCAGILIMSNAWVNAFILIDGNSKCRRFLAFKLGASYAMNFAPSTQHS